MLARRAQPIDQLGQRKQLIEGHAEKSALVPPHRGCLRVETGNDTTKSAPDSTITALSTTDLFMSKFIFAEDPRSEPGNPQSSGLGLRGGDEDPRRSTLRRFIR